MPRHKRSAEDVATAKALRQYVRETVRKRGGAKSRAALARATSRQARVEAAMVKRGVKPAKAKRSTRVRLTDTDINYIVATQRKKGYPLNVEFAPTRRRKPAAKRTTAKSKLPAPAPVKRARARVKAAAAPAKKRAPRRKAVVTVPLLGAITKPLRAPRKRAAKKA